QVLYLVPEIALTTQITTRLSRIFGNKMGVYHSKFPDAERVEIWKKQSSEHPYQLLLGVRSSLLLPFNHLGLIIVDEEHETSYKQQDPAPRYNARDAALLLAHQFGANTLLGTATPSLESYANAKNGKYGLVCMTTRFGEVQLPKIEVVDVKELRRKKSMKSPFSPRLIEEIQHALDHQKQVILFQNRRGYSPIMECHKCGWVPRCQQCDVSLTYHREQQRLVCHYCGRSYQVPTQCPSCEETDLRNLGYGTEKIEEQIHQLFPTARTARMDLDTTRSRLAYESMITNFQQGHTDILIGTQMVTKGLDFKGVKVVGILDADTMLNQPDFRSYERSFQMMSQVSGRAGRRETQGLVLLQTKQKDLAVIQQVVNHDYAALFAEQMEERKLFHYPPYYRLTAIYLKHRDAHLVEEAAQTMGNRLRFLFGERVLGPDRPAVARIQLQYIRKILLKVERGAPMKNVRKTLLAVQQEVLAMDRYKAIHIYFDVDPL
ncbi:MAG: primosomal protein N', partial [Bacteroidaceae bacterium]